MFAFFVQLNEESSLSPNHNDHQNSFFFRLDFVALFLLYEMDYHVELLFFFIRTPIFPQPGRSYFLAISASDILFDVLNHLTMKIKYRYTAI